MQEDATGVRLSDSEIPPWREIFYGPLGEVVKNIRTIVIPQHDEQTYTTEWTYDTWNRLTSMIYADGEEVTYTYNAGDRCCACLPAEVSHEGRDGKKKSATFSYVKQLGYDKFVEPQAKSRMSAYRKMRIRIMRETARVPGVWQWNENHVQL